MNCCPILELPYYNILLQRVRRAPEVFELSPTSRSESQGCKLQVPLNATELLDML